jgi:hypothetical protein
MTPEEFAHEWLCESPEKPRMVLKPTEVRFVYTGERAIALLWNCYSPEGVGVSHDAEHAYHLWKISARGRRTVQRFPVSAIIAPNQKRMVVRVVLD